MASTPNKDAENSSDAALAHKQQPHPSPLVLDCLQVQHDESYIHDS